jgi:Repeat of unknown function (DUF5648)
LFGKRGSGQWKGRDVKHVDGEILIGLKPEQVKVLGLTERQSIERTMPQNSRILSISGLGVVCIQLPPGEDLSVYLDKLAIHPLVRYTEPHIIHEVTSVVLPNEYQTLQSLQAAQWGLADINAPSAWPLTEGSSAVTIAVVDSGFAGPERASGAVYRWWNSGVNDHFYTEDPLGELAHGGGYVYEGSPFRLFAAGTTSTTPFYRWFRPASGQHFYTTDPSGELAPSIGFHLEGVIGNIAASPLPGTVALYRWYNTASGDHFYTTDPTGELAPSGGYHLEGISGYVLNLTAGMLSHPDLNEIPRISTGFDYVHNDNFPVDDYGHGTHVAGMPEPIPTMELASQASPGVVHYAAPRSSITKEMRAMRT